MVASIPGLTDEQKRRVLGRNAVAWFGLTPAELPETSVYFQHEEVAVLRDKMPQTLTRRCAATARPAGRPLQGNYEPAPEGASTPLASYSLRPPYSGQTDHPVLGVCPRTLIKTVRLNPIACIRFALHGKARQWP